MSRYNLMYLYVFLIHHIENVFCPIYNSNSKYYFVYLTKLGDINACFLKFSISIFIFFFQSDQNFYICVILKVCMKLTMDHQCLMVDLAIDSYAAVVIHKHIKQDDLK